MRNRIFLLAFIILITFILGEVKLYFPLFGSDFRFSLSAAAFFFFLLWFRQLTVLEIGLGVSILLPLFRVFLNMLLDGKGFFDVFPTHAPTAIYYLAFTLLFLIFSLRRNVNKTWKLILLGIICDLVSNTAELLIRGGLDQFNGWDTRFLIILVTFAVLRVLFVVGFFNMFTLNQYRLLGEQQKEQIEQLMMINTGLYEEGFYLKKSVVQVEEITRDSYQLYRNLRSIENEDSSYTGLSRSALHIAEKIHELKKDSQRVISGLLKLMNQEKLNGEMTFYEISKFVIHANEKYGEMLGKKIQFTYNSSQLLKTNRVYALLSILNNLVSNAVEAIEKEGHIRLTMELDRGNIIWFIRDDGPGIDPRDAAVIFEPGYTTKFDHSGNASTGIGLIHCLEIASSLHGKVYLADDQEETTFVVSIPYSSLNDNDGSLDG
jgi:two-component system sensor histidine kinase YcbA